MTERDREAESRMSEEDLRKSREEAFQAYRAEQERRTSADFSATIIDYLMVMIVLAFMFILML